jgi:putative pyruvate formate lyase activating enzyme
MNLEKCNICPKKCLVNRKINQFGFCKAGSNLQIAWFGKHFGEEPPISSTNGSGTIFFMGCNLKCVYCQNWQISQEWQKNKKNTYEINDVVQIILSLQKQGCQNINLVTPTLWSFQLKEVLIKARKKGLLIPVIWNSNAYEKAETLKELEGLIDVYLPDYKYYYNELANKYSFSKDYSNIAQKAILEMYRQVGDFEEIKNKDKGIETAKIKGLIVRHLVLPEQINNTIECLRFIRLISPKIHLSLMTQYNPLYKAKEFLEINRTLNSVEYDEVVKKVKDLGFENGWIQEFNKSVKCFTPDFKKENPFS